MEKFLYGASVQGIQSFIFQTNQLDDISGASELVESICTKAFEKAVGEGFNKKDNAVIMAAGNVKYVFDTQERGAQLPSEGARVRARHNVQPSCG